DATLGVALGLGVRVRTLQEEAVPVALEEELQRRIGALRALATGFGGNRDGLQHAVAVDVHAVNRVLAGVVQAAEREARVVEGHLVRSAALLRRDRKSGV